MRLEWRGTREIASPVERVWATLLDPQAIARCAGATDGARLLGEHRYAVTTRIGILFVKLPITLEVEMLDLAPPASGRMQVRGTGPGTGLVGGSTVRLETNGNGRTRLHWTAETTVHGRLAEFGATLVEPIIRSTIEGFWDDFARNVR